jgi:hypothetical protein
MAAVGVMTVPVHMVAMGVDPMTVPVVARRFPAMMRIAVEIGLKAGRRMTGSIAVNGGPKVRRVPVEK